MRLLAKATGVFNNIIGSFAFVGGAFIVTAMLIVVLEVVMRYFLSRPQVWVAESVEYLLVWITFLAAAWILKIEGHVSVNLLFDRLNPRAQVVLGTITSVVSAIICFLFMVYGTQIVIEYFQKGIRTVTVLAPLKAPLFMIIPMGSFLLFIQFLRRSHGYLKRWKTLPG